MKTWLEIEDDSDFTLSNLPYGIMDSKNKRICIALSFWAIDLNALLNKGYLNELGFKQNEFIGSTLNSFIEKGKKKHQNLRKRVQNLFGVENTNQHENLMSCLILREHCEFLMPLSVGDYTDFYSSKYHAENVGKLFRSKEQAVFPNWTQMPIAYHGRSSSIGVSGETIFRPLGQFIKNDLIVLGPTEKLDYELEMAFVIGKNTEKGQSVSTTEAKDYIFGLVLFNDWSARDIQSWEYKPLGPFLGKNFCSSISPWIVPIEAFEDLWEESTEDHSHVLPYLQERGKGKLDIELKVFLETTASETLICQTSTKHLYWSMSQQLAHHTINGCNVRVGDLLASGTISGPEENGNGCLLEKTKNGKEPIKISDSEIRSFLLDGDKIRIEGSCGAGSTKIGFGQLYNQIEKKRWHTGM